MTKAGAGGLCAHQALEDERDQASEGIGQEGEMRQDSLGAPVRCCFQPQTPAECGQERA